MGSAAPRRKSWYRQLPVPGSLFNESISSVDVPPAIVYTLPQSEILIGNFPIKVRSKPLCH